MVSFAAVVGIIIVVIVFIVLIVVLALNFTPKRSDRAIGEHCNGDDECSVGLSCESNICKANVGSACTKRTDCVQAATACAAGICVEKAGTLGEPCSTTMPCADDFVCDSSVCKSDIGAPCQSIGDCVTMATGCVDNICVETVTPNGPSEPSSSDDDSDVCSCYPTIRYRHTGKTYRETIESISGRNVQDIVTHNGNTITVYRDGTITREKDDVIMTVKSSHYPERIISYQGDLMALVNGNLLTLSSPLTSSYWKWGAQDYMIDRVEHVSQTLDGVHLWLQSPYMHNESKTRGYLYRGEDIVKTYTFDSGVTRVYGRNTLSYLEIDRQSLTATRYPDIKTYKNVYDGALTRSGEAIIISPNVDIIVRDLNDKVTKVET